MNNTTSTQSSINGHEYQKEELNIYYTICEVLVAIVAVVGNALVIFVFRKERRLRRRTNYYIVSLAVADFLVGLLGIPFAIMSSIGLPTNLYACLFTVSLLVVLCTISIFCLVAVSVDRYWAILYPMGYSRNVRTKTAIVIISICWVMGGIIGFLPLLGWHKDAPTSGRCFFLDVMDYNYLVFLYFGTIITPALLLAAFYAHIYQVVLKQLRRIVTMNPNATSATQSGGTMLRMLGAARKREVKATQNLSIIVLFFMLCWIPLYTINCVLAFCHECQIDATFMLLCIILSHLNSAGNPLLYAYHLKDFRAALRNFFCRWFGYAEQPIPGQYVQTTWSQRKGRRTEFALVPKISTIVKSSATLATAAAGEAWDAERRAALADELDDVFLPFDAAFGGAHSSETNLSAARVRRAERGARVEGARRKFDLFFIDCDFRQMEGGDGKRFCKSASSVGNYNRALEGVFKRKKQPVTRSLSDNGGVGLIDNVTIC